MSDMTKRSDSFRTSAITDDPYLCIWYDTAGTPGGSGSDGSDAEMPSGPVSAQDDEMPSDHEDGELMDDQVLKTLWCYVGKPLKYV